MAGIGFSLRKMLADDSSYVTKVRAWFHTAIVSSGPWIISILAINMVLTYSRRWGLPEVEKDLLIGIIIYSTIFSQVLTAPFQMIITRYIADRIYSEEYDYIKPSFWGVSLILSAIAFSIAVVFYRRTPLPLNVLYMTSALAVVLTILWMLMVYQSTLRNFTLITLANLIGLAVTFLLILFLTNNPLQFREYIGTANLLFAYLGGITIFTLMLLITFLIEMQEDNGKVFHFIRYFHTVPSLWPIGLLYTLTLWTDNVIIWFSPISIQVISVFRYAPAYDLATFYAYITILPSIMLFLVLIETDFYVKCREFYLVILRNGPLEDIVVFADRMRNSLKQNILTTFEVQICITVICIAAAQYVFPYFNVAEQTLKIFTVYALGAFCNAFVLIFLQVLLYIGERNRTLLLMAIFFVLNTSFTLVTLLMGEQFFGWGFFAASFLTMLTGAWFTLSCYKRVIYHTYITQPVYNRSQEKFFEKLERRLDSRLENKDALDLLILKKQMEKRELHEQTQGTELKQSIALNERVSRFLRKIFPVIKPKANPEITFYDVKEKNKFTTSSYSIRKMNNRFFAVTQSPTGPHKCWLIISNAHADHLRDSSPELFTAEEPIGPRTNPDT